VLNARGHPKSSVETERLLLRVPELTDAEALNRAPDDLRSIRIATKIGERFEQAGMDPVSGEPAHMYTIARH
jgi:RimJ/RimL family protein N-acetyltransferase